MSRIKKSKLYLVIAVYIRDKKWKYYILIAKRRNSVMAMRFGYQQFKKMGFEDFKIGVKKEPIEISELSYRTQKYVMKETVDFRGYVLSEGTIHKCSTRRNINDVMLLILSDWRFRIDMLE